MPNRGGFRGESLPRVLQTSKLKLAFLVPLVLELRCSQVKERPRSNLMLPCRVTTPVGGQERTPTKTTLASQHPSCRAAAVSGNPPPVIGGSSREPGLALRRREPGGCGDARAGLRRRCARRASAVVRAQQPLPGLAPSLPVIGAIIRRGGPSGGSAGAASRQSGATSARREGRLVCA